MIKYVGYFREKLKKESHSVSKWDLWNSTKFEKKVEEGTLTAEDVARSNHDKLLGYEFCIVEPSSLYPYCCVTIVPKNKHIGVNFIDEEGRRYLTYLFHEVKKDRTLFLQEIWYYRFKEDSDEEEYRIHFVFNETGEYSARKYIDSGEKYEDYEGNTSIDISGLYEKYPEFGRYEGITKIERTALGGIIPTKKEDNPKIIPYKTHNGKEYTQEEWEKYEQEQWEKYKKNN